MFLETLLTIATLLGLLLAITVLGPFLSNTLLAPGNHQTQQQSEQKQLQKFTAWLVIQVSQQANSSGPISAITKNRVQGAAVKALYHLKKNQSVRIQLPDLIPTEHGYADFEISITKGQLKDICA